MENKIATLTGGRAAEEVEFGTITTGASNDIEQATKLARAMITRYGMSDEFDMVAMETVTNQYLGGDTTLACSAETQSAIDKKVVELVKKQHEKAKEILLDNKASSTNWHNICMKKRRSPERNSWRSSRTENTADHVLFRNQNTTGRPEGLPACIKRYTLGFSSSLP